MSSNEILAAISASLAWINNKPESKLVVKSYTRIPQRSPVWNIAGRTETTGRSFKS